MIISWCTLSDAIQTAAMDAENDYKLKNLVELFNLSGDLVGAF